MAEIKNRKRRKADRDFARRNRTRLAMTLGVLIGLRCHGDDTINDVPATCKEFAKRAKMLIRFDPAMKMTNQIVPALALVLDEFIDSDDEEWQWAAEFRLEALSAGVDYLGALSSVVQRRRKRRS